MCAHGTSSLVMNLIYGAGFSNNGRGNGMALMVQLVMGLLPIAIGIFLIVRSRWLTAKLFNDESE